MTVTIILLAAGQGTRMNSKKQKILHEVGGKPMVMHGFEAAEQVADYPPVLVVGAGAEGVKALIGRRAQYVLQTEQLGTGHAVMMCHKAFQGWEDAQQVIVTYGDMPLLRRETLAQLAQRQLETGAIVVMLSVFGEADSPFGRVVRDENGRISEIVEVAEAKKRPNTAELLAIREHNVGVYCFDAPWLWRHIHQLPIRQARSGQEYYLTDLIGMAVAQQEWVEAVLTPDPDEGLGAGTRQEMVAVEKAFRRRINAHWLANGVTLIDPDSTYIDPDVAIGRDTVIWPNSYIQGTTVIGEDCTVGPNSIVRNAQIGNGCRVEQAVVDGVQVKDGEQIRPFSYLAMEETK